MSLEDARHFFTLLIEEMAYIYLTDSNTAEAFLDFLIMLIYPSDHTGFLAFDGEIIKK